MSSQSHRSLPRLTLQLPPTMCPGLTLNKDPPQLQHHLGITTAGPSSHQQGPVGTGEREGAEGTRHTKSRTGFIAAFPAAGKGREGLKGAQRSRGEEPDASLATGNQTALGWRGKGWLWRGDHACRNQSACTTSIPNPVAPPPWGATWHCHIPATPGEHHPTMVHGTAVSGSKVLVWGTARTSSPARALGTGGLPATGKRLTGVKPSEFGTAVRKSRPAREP